MRITKFISVSEDILRTIVSGMKNLKTINIRYRDKKGRMTSRNLEPYKVTVENGKDILYAYCLLRQDNHIRKFYLDNIISASLNVKDFKPRWDIEVDPPFDKILEDVKEI